MSVWILEVKFLGTQKALPGSMRMVCETRDLEIHQFGLVSEFSGIRDGSRGQVSGRHTRLCCLTNCFTGSQPGYVKKALERKSSSCVQTFCL